MPMNLGMGSSSAPTPIESKRSSDDDAPKEDSAESEHLESPDEDSTSNAETPARRRRWVKRILGLLVIGGLAVGAGALWPTVNGRFVEPVEEAAANLTDVQERTEQLDSTSVDLTTRIGNLEDDLAALNTETTQRLDELDSTLTGLDALVAAQSTRLDELDALAVALGEDLNETNSAAALQLDLTRAAELMSRARLFLFQANYGLAAGDLDSARATLLGIDADELGGDADINAVVDRLERAITNLPDRPVSAASDLDIAWQELLQPEQPTVLPFRVDEDEESESDGLVGGEATNEDAEVDESDDLEGSEAAG